MAHDTYFKFMSFGPHTRLSMYMLLKHKSLFFAYKNVLNDPTDCSPFFYVELKDNQLESHIREIAEDNENESADVIQDAIQIIELFEQKKGKAPETKSAQLRRRSRFFRFGYFPTDDPIEIAKAFISHHMRLQVDEARIFSMSKRVDEPRLWAHYSSSHSGFCLELDGLSDRPRGVILDRVDYTTRRPRISVADIKGMRSNEKTRSEIYSRMFFQKSTGWDYEDEQRLVLPRLDQSEDIPVLRFPEGHYIPFKKLKIKSIYFGMNCSTDNIDMVRNLTSQFLKQKPSLKFAVQSEDNYEIRFEDIDHLYV
ncbi:DUF2971 domain-containing protein [Mesorhizobium sp. Z1-4]|uniref:DUF2971 domain-containing protein n=1 Tax=Mesorhizobium sp. Z1-4 TaxID=2448478 RepID=UPI000FDAF334|nr:DUF2971 domain-containing protein [Mesorhizobium sp. Z1-4]